ncbi:hypothetical protein [Stenotrophomonas maltophilia]|uniref:hypothetical protein n=1 Tax=Stenotrophomonas maltophilia TaxID=40324 RepID=UPI000D0CA3D7|nr:hypothetical protein [Stenotrophomonas maltophilia]PSM12658.1 hypothetical protein CV100_16060 [Stenotrophomonas maltophilia]
MEKHTNLTHNQHFVSQAEQRMNSCSDNPSKKKAKIFRFTVDENQPSTINPQNKATIEKNLAFHDLFTIMRTDHDKRINLEALFNRYETDYAESARSIIEAISMARSNPGSATLPLAEERREYPKDSPTIDLIKRIYRHKILVGARNPLRVKETLGRFQDLLDHSVADLEALALHWALDGKDPREERHICETYKLSRGDYRKWIRLLILLLYRKADEEALLDGCVDEFFNAKDYMTLIQVHSFKEGCALLPDTGVVTDALDDGIVTYMNVSKHCIIAVQHTKIETPRFDALCRSRRMTFEERREAIESLGSSIQACLVLDDRAILEGYNNICVKACASEVFSGAKEVPGIRVAEKRGTASAVMRPTDDDPSTSLWFDGHANDPQRRVWRMHAPPAP